MDQLLKDPNVVSLITTLVVLSVSLLKLVDFLIKSLIKKLTPKASILTDEETHILQDINKHIISLCDKNDDLHEWIRELKDQHSRTDRDGIPLWYVPRSLVEMQKEIINLLQKVSQHQAKMNYVLESLIDRVNDIKER